MYAYTSITFMQYLNNLLDIVHVHLFTASPLTSQQVEFIHPSTTTEFACTFFTNKVALSRSTPLSGKDNFKEHIYLKKVL